MNKKDMVRQKNPFFSPKVGIQPKFLIKRFTLTFIAEYEYDISKLGWRRTAFAVHDPLTIEKFRQSCFTGMVGCSYRLFNYSKPGTYKGAN